MSAYSTWQSLAAALPQYHCLSQLSAIVQQSAEPSPYASDGTRGSAFSLSDWGGVIKTSLRPLRLTPLPYYIADVRHSNNHLILTLQRVHSDTKDAAGGQAEYYVAVLNDNRAAHNVSDDVVHQLHTALKDGTSLHSDHMLLLALQHQPIVVTVTSTKRCVLVSSNGCVHVSHHDAETGWSTVHTVQLPAAPAQQEVQLHAAAVSAVTDSAVAVVWCPRESKTTQASYKLHAARCSIEHSAAGVQLKMGSMRILPVLSGQVWQLHPHNHRYIVASGQSDASQGTAHYLIEPSTLRCRRLNFEQQLLIQNAVVDSGSDKILLLTSDSDVWQASSRQRALTRIDAKQGLPTPSSYSASAAYQADSLFATQSVTPGSMVQRLVQYDVPSQRVVTARTLPLSMSYKQHVAVRVVQNAVFVLAGGSVRCLHVGSTQAPPSMADAGLRMIAGGPDKHREPDVHLANAQNDISPEHIDAEHRPQLKLLSTEERVARLMSSPTSITDAGNSWIALAEDAPDKLLEACKRLYNIPDHFDGDAAAPHPLLLWEELNMIRSQQQQLSHQYSDLRLPSVTAYQQQLPKFELLVKLYLAAQIDQLVQFVEWFTSSMLTAEVMKAYVVPLHEPPQPLICSDPSTTNITRVNYFARALLIIAPAVASSAGASDLSSVVQQLQRAAGLELRAVRQLPPLDVLQWKEMRSVGTQSAIAT